MESNKNIKQVIEASMIKQDIVKTVEQPMEAKAQPELTEAPKPARARARRAGYQMGTLYIPPERIPPGKHLRFINYTDNDIARVRTLGYELVSVRDPEFKDLLSFLGDGTLADGYLKEGGHVVCSKGGQKIILVECPIEFKRQGELEKDGLVKNNLKVTPPEHGLTQGYYTESK